MLKFCEPIYHVDTFVNRQRENAFGVGAFSLFSEKKAVD